MDLEPRKHGQRFHSLIKAYKRIMSFSLSARKVVGCWCSLLAIPAVVFSQNSFAPSGSEYSIAGKLPGDQVHPQLSFTTNGGYIVWQDNWVDGKGLGIGAMRLKNDLTASHLSFRVNSLVAGDQENAQVSMLNDGGAVFAWQGGQLGFQHIYSRFLSSSNSWLTGDLQVNAATNRFQMSPAVATLLNGNVAVVYVSEDQAAPRSMKDVYLQMFAPNGSKLGGEIQVNQFTDNNQRNPAVTALADGKLAIAWVSEQQRWTDASNGVPSVDIYARVFDASGSALGDEFLVNSGANICAYPDFASAPDGGFMATWMERDLVVRNNGWDIYARRFTSAFVGGNVSRLNTQLYGDQYLSKIRRCGTTYMAIWTSLQQDGSLEGVFGRYVNDDGSVSGDEFLVNTKTFGPQEHQVLGSDGSGRFLAAWTSFGVGINGFDLFGQQYANPALTVIGTNNSAFNTDPNADPNSVSNTPPVETPGLPAPGCSTNSTPTVTNTFSDVKGIYNGLLYDPAAPTTGSSGYITITTTARGGFSAKLKMGAKKYSFSGMFDSTGANTTTLGTLKINLLLDLHGGNIITGNITDGTWTASLQADLAYFGKFRHTSLTGPYTIIVQPGDGSMGNGVGTAKVSSSGAVTWALTLPDGTKLSGKTTLSKTGAWPLYAAPYKSRGMAIGWMQFGSPGDGFDGQCVWTKPAGMAAPYSDGLTNGVTISGASYKAPPLSYRTFGGSKVIFNGGGLAAPITNSVTWDINNKVIVQNSANALKLSLSASSGLFKGTIKDANGRAVPFEGVLFEKNNVGVGFFLGADQSGAVTFAPNP
jgi:hypothetical protein